MILFRKLANIKPQQQQQQHQNVSITDFEVVQTLVQTDMILFIKM